jgi:hypothetical protein
VNASSFNPDQFLSTSVSEANDTKLILVPVGVVQSAQVSKLDLRKLDANDQNPERFILEVIWIALDESVKKETGLDKPTVRQSIWLDTLPSGALDMGKGKNVGLGRLREAVGQNKAGKSWAMNMLNGATASLLIEHVLNKKDEQTYAQVKRVGAPGSFAEEAPASSERRKRA